MPRSNIVHMDFWGRIRKLGDIEFTNPNPAVKYSGTIQFNQKPTRIPFPNQMPLSVHEAVQNQLSFLRNPCRLSAAHYFTEKTPAIEQIFESIVDAMEQWLEDGENKENTVRFLVHTKHINIISAILASLFISPSEQMISQSVHILFADSLKQLDYEADQLKRQEACGSTNTLFNCRYFSVPNRDVLVVELKLTIVLDKAEWSQFFAYVLFEWIQVPIKSESDINLSLLARVKQSL